MILEEELRAIESIESTKEEEDRKEVCSTPIARRLFAEAPAERISKTMVAETRMAVRLKLAELSMTPYVYSDVERREAEAKVEAERKTPEVKAGATPANTANMWQAIVKQVVAAIINKSSLETESSAEDMCSKAIEVVRGTAEPQTSFVNRIERDCALPTGSQKP